MISESLDPTLPDFADQWRVEVMTEALSFTENIRALENSMNLEERESYNLNNLAFKVSK